MSRRGLPLSPSHSGNLLRLISQSPAFVSSSSGVTLSLEVDSPQPASRLSLLVTLFSHVSARYTLRQTLSGDTAGLSALPGGPEIPLDTAGMNWAPGREITVHLPVSAPDLPGQARGGTRPRRSRHQRVRPSQLWRRLSDGGLARRLRPRADPHLVHDRPHRDPSFRAERHVSRPLRLDDAARLLAGDRPGSAAGEGRGRSG